MNGWLESLFKRVIHFTVYDVVILLSVYDVLFLGDRIVPIHRGTLGA